MDMLLDAFEGFRKTNYETSNPLMPRLADEGQTPRYVIVSCIDSRGNAMAKFPLPPGQVVPFNAPGGIIRPYKKGTALASTLEVAIDSLHVPILVLTGHTQCAAAKLLIDGTAGEETESFIEVAREGLESAKQRIAEKKSTQDLSVETEQRILVISRRNVQAYPSVKRAMERNNLSIRTLHFDMQAGNLWEYNPQTDYFDLLTHHHGPIYKAHKDKGREKKTDHHKCEIC